MQSTDDFLNLVRRGREGFRAFAASIDLLGMKDLMVKRPHEALAILGDVLGDVAAFMAFC